VLAACLILVACADPEPEAAPDDEEEARFSHCEGETDAHRNFDAFWSYFDREYALFDLRLPGESWYDLGAEGCTAIDDAIATHGEMTDRELFDLMVRTAEHLDDGHVYIDVPRTNMADDAWVSEYPHYDALYEIEDNVEASYLDEPEYERAGWNEFSWGTIGDIGFLSITSMEGLDRDADQNATDQDEHTIDEEAAERAMTKVMEDLRDAPGMIVDIRANEGGWDTVSLVIAAWFAGPRTVAWSEQVRSGTEHLDFGPWVDTYVDAARSSAYAGPVVLLTSGGTFSAAEVFVLAMRVRDDVTVLGERTSGHFSDQLGTKLPNGWSVDLSNERYRAADGIVYEVEGAPVDIDVPLDVDALAQGRDTMLEAAIEFLQAL
jgi:hypothetical protein